ncbi:hypothetical protein [Candidatus Avelusimicrobium sp.]|uniref:hypothetical protein n=1 Tax=Candidatus Avelusimicrobium sp. TaxID=3048833 RepID=UPI003D7D9ADB
MADFDFDTNLRVANYKQGYTMQADNMYLSELTLFGYKFPACIGETMSWQKLKLKNKEEVYLVCGEAEKGSCDPPAGEPTSEPCDSPATGTKTRTWNYDTCQWNAWNLLNCRLDLDKDKTYTCTLTNEGYTAIMPYNTTCPATCAINATTTTADNRSPFLSSGGKLVTTTNVIVSQCNSSTVGNTCKVGAVKAKPDAPSDRSYYCPTYTCQEK